MTAEQGNRKETGLRKEDWVPNRAVRKSDPRGMHIQDMGSSIQGNLHVRSIVLLVELDIEPKSTVIKNERLRTVHFLMCAVLSRKSRRRGLETSFPERMPLTPG